MRACRCHAVAAVPNSIDQALSSQDELQAAEDKPGVVALDLSLSMYLERVCMVGSTAPLALSRGPLGCVEIAESM